MGQAKADFEASTNKRVKNVETIVINLSKVQRETENGLKRRYETKKKHMEVLSNAQIYYRPVTKYLSPLSRYSNVSPISAHSNKTDETNKTED